MAIFEVHRQSRAQAARHLGSISMSASLLSDYSNQFHLPRHVRKLAELKAKACCGKPPTSQLNLSWHSPDHLDRSSPAFSRKRSTTTRPDKNRSVVVAPSDCLWWNRFEHVFVWISLRWKGEGRGKKTKLKVEENYEPVNFGDFIQRHGWSLFNEKRNWEEEIRFRFTIHCLLPAFVVIFFFHPLLRFTTFDSHQFIIFKVILVKMLMNLLTSAPIQWSSALCSHEKCLNMDIVFGADSL
jgi:hypothetical protein